MGNSGLQMSSKPGIIVILEILVSQYCKYYSQGIVVFLVSNAHVDSRLLTDYLDWLLGARHCISPPAIGCSSYTHILSRDFLRFHQNNERIHHINF